jgi:hypothetical protein
MWGGGDHPIGGSTLFSVPARQIVPLSQHDLGTPIPVHVPSPTLASASTVSPASPQTICTSAPTYSSSSSSSSTSSLQSNEAALVQLLSLTREIHGWMKAVDVRLNRLEARNALGPQQASNNPNAQTLMELDASRRIAFAVNNNKKCRDRFLAKVRQTARLGPNKGGVFLFEAQDELSEKLAEVICPHACITREEWHSAAKESKVVKGVLRCALTDQRTAIGTATKSAFAALLQSTKMLELHAVRDAQQRLNSVARQAAQSAQQNQSTFDAAAGAMAQALSHTALALVAQASNNHMAQTLKAEIIDTTAGLATQIFGSQQHSNSIVQAVTAAISHTPQLTLDWTKTSASQLVDEVAAKMSAPKEALSFRAMIIAHVSDTIFIFNFKLQSSFRHLREYSSG